MFTKIINNQKGFILITTYMVMAVLFILSSAYLIYAITENRASQRERWAQEAFYAAEEGIAYAVAESRAQADYEWFTHNSATVGDIYQGTPAIQSWLNLIPAPTFDGIYDIATGQQETGLYHIPGRNFLVKTYPDPIFPGVTVIRSVGQIFQGATVVAQRAIEYRLTRTSMFQYFMFFASSQYFGLPVRTIYDAGGLGGIRVNGNISLYGPDFRNLTTLTCSGYFKTPNSSMYADPASYDSRYWDNTTKSYKTYSSADPRYNDGKAEWPRETYIPAWNFGNYDYSTYPFWNIDDCFQVDLAFDYNNNIRAKINGVNIPTRLGDGYADAYYNWKMYGGGSSTVTFEVTPEVLQALGVVDATALYNKMNAYRWTGIRNEADWLNTDFEYGRGLNTSEDSKYVKVNYLDTQQPGQVKYWNELLADPDQDPSTLDALTEVVADANAGIKAIKTSLIDTKKKKDAKEAGVYIRDYDLNYSDWDNNFYQPYQKSYNNWFDTVYVPWVKSGVVLSWVNNVFVPWLETHPYGQPTWQEWLNQYSAFIAANPMPVAPEYSGVEYVEQKTVTNPLSACSEVKWFYNCVRPPKQGSVPKRTKVLEIDVEKMMDLGLAPKNGILYVDLRDTNSYGGANADYSVMLVNAEKLSPGGLTVVSPSSVYIKGNYNTDTERQSSAIITNSLIYTLSDKFKYPGSHREDLAYMPMPYHYIQYPNSTSYDDFLTNYVPHLNTRMTNWTTQFPDDPPPNPDTATNVLANWIKAHLTGSEISQILNAGEDQYDSKHDKTSGPNIMADQAGNTTYNVAMITPYDPQGYNLERWGGKNRVIQGAFLQLDSSEIPATKDAAQKGNNGYIPSTYSHGYVISDGTYSYLYEPRFGQTNPDRPPGDLYGGYPSSWVEVDPGQL